MVFTIETAKSGDEYALAHIQTESWKAAFRNILTPDVLEKSTEKERAVAMYQRIMANGVGHGYMLRVDGEPHCIAWWDASRETDMPGYAELICIHSLPNRWHMGFGSQMLCHVMNDMIKAGYRKAMLWVFEANIPARKFYEKHGFVFRGRKKLLRSAYELCYEKVLT